MDYTKTVCEQHACSCPATEDSTHCHVFDRLMSSTDKKICRGERCSEVRRKAYLRLWLSQSNAPPEAREEQKKVENLLHSQSRPVTRVSRGAGDTVKKVIDTISGGRIKPCGGCKKRQAWLNQKIKKEYPPLCEEPITPEDSIRHLVFHVFPLESPRDWVWKSHLERILSNLDIWNGKKFLSLVTASSKDRNKTDLQSFEENYQQRFVDAGFEIFVTENNSKRREGLQFIDILKELESLSPQEAIACGHTKGVTYGDNPASVIHEWSEVMWRTVFHNWQEAIHSLNGHCCSGSFKRYGAFKTLGNHRWHYSGTFYWLRSVELFRRNWEYIDKAFFGTESYVGSHFKPEEAACLFSDHTQDLYQQDYWQSQIEPAYQKWKKDHED